ncbi:MAG: hypothetical protein GTO63_36825, partial [Anaerolineae bacterium]|nr:hypothetical protein [Anaerolineae bacterium]NIO00319.1 hypothetical protein [Anaerolineae bacterium]NIQ83095.1 hypothetical protein [Anaerolineae bacterium]
MRRAVLLVMFLLVFAAASSAFATTYYVDDDATSPYLGTSDQPFLHPQDAADVVDPGDTVIVRDGTYYDSPPDASEPSIIKLSRTNGTSSNPIVFRSENPWGAVLDGDSNAADWGIQIWNPSGNASYVTIEGFEIKDCASSGIHTWDADHVLIKGN